MAEETLQIVAKGKVQGVFYRAAVWKTAKEMKINGFVQNLEEDGTVKIIAQAEKSILLDFLKKINIQHNQIQAKELVIDKLHSDEKFNDFVIR